VHIVETIVPLTQPLIGEAEERAVIDVLRSGWLVQGQRVFDFERRVAEYCGAAHAVATTNCTTALQLALGMLSLQPGDEVIVPSFTFVASVNAILHAGGTPRIVDVEPDTWNIDIGAAASAINHKTRAIMPVDQFGLAADLHAVNALARARGLRVVEDAAPALGAAIDGQRIGSISETACFSFHPRKTITSAEGGMLLTNSSEVAERARLLRSHGASVSDLARHGAEGVVIEEYPEAGFNYRMSDLHAAVGLAQMDRLDWLIARRRELAANYDEAFKSLGSVETPKARSGFLHTYQSYCLVLTDGSPLSRADAMAALKTRGISTRRGCMAVHLERYFVKRFGHVRLPVAERLAAQSITLPLFPTMPPEQQSQVIGSVCELLC